MKDEDQKELQRLFEKLRRKRGWTPQMLQRHVFGKTWIGSKNMMPTYVDAWTEVQWKGWIDAFEVMKAKDPGYAVDVPDTMYFGTRELTEHKASGLHIGAATKAPVKVWAVPARKPTEGDDK